MSGITLVVEDDDWRKRGLRPALLRGAQAAARRVKLRGPVTILLAGDKKLAALNRDFRGKTGATNVLSFPGFDGHGGDIAIAYGITAKEAKAAGKSMADHAMHLAVHGVLHLAGYDHERLKDARVMEPLEVKILARLGIADPYAEEHASPASEAAGGGGGRSNAPARRIRDAERQAKLRRPEGARR